MPAGGMVCHHSMVAEAVWSPMLAIAVGAACGALLRWQIGAHHLKSEYPVRGYVTESQRWQDGVGKLSSALHPVQLLSCCFIYSCLPLVLLH